MGHGITIIAFHSSNTMTKVLAETLPQIWKIPSKITMKVTNPIITLYLGSPMNKFNNWQR